MAEKSAYEEILRDWESFLKLSKHNHIRIQNMDTRNFLRKPELGAGRSAFHWKDIAGYGSVVLWFDEMISTHALKNIKVCFRKKSGGSGTTAIANRPDREFDVSNRANWLKSQRKISMESTTEASQKTMALDLPKQAPTHIPQQGLNGGQPGVPTPPPAPFSPFASPQYQQQAPPGGLNGAIMYGMGGAAAAAHAAGMGVHEYTELKKNADRASEYKEELLKLKEELSGLKVKNNELESKVMIADQAKDLAVQTALLSKKGWADSEAVQKLLETAPAMLQMMASKGQSALPQQGGLASPGLSQEKQELIGYIQYDDVKPNMVNALQQTLMHLLGTAGYEDRLQQLNAIPNGQHSNG